MGEWMGGGGSELPRLWLPLRLQIRSKISRYEPTAAPSRSRAGACPARLTCWRLQQATGGKARIWRGVRASGAAAAAAAAAAA